MHIVFTSNRLLFREFTSEDAGLIYELNSDPEVLQYVHEPATTPHNAPDVLANIILPQYRLYNHGRWAVHLRNTMEFIGWCGLKFRPEKNYVDLGYRFMKKYWGKGYATEAAQGTLDYGFNVLGLQHIFAMAHVNNTSSWKVLEKCGMQFMGEDTIDDTPVRTYEMTSSHKK